MSAVVRVKIDGVQLESKRASVKGLMAGRFWRNRRNRGVERWLTRLRVSLRDSRGNSVNNET